MPRSKKKLFIQLIIIAFACASIYYSYSHIKNDEGYKNTIASVITRTSLGSELGFRDETTKIDSDDVITLVNEARNSIDSTLRTLVKNEKLTNSALAKVEDMVAKGYFEHETPEGYNVEYFIDNAGYEHITVAENLASGDFVNAQTLVDAWMNSPGHRANIVSIDSMEIGVAVLYTEFQGRLQYVAVQHFGRPRSNCPSINDALGVSIQTKKAMLLTMEEEFKELKAKIDNEGPGASDYEGDIEAYNALVNEYNNLTITIKKDIETYNVTIREFNECIGADTSHYPH